MLVGVKCYLMKFTNGTTSPFMPTAHPQTTIEPIYRHVPMERRNYYSHHQYQVFKLSHAACSRTEPLCGTNHSITLHSLLRTGYDLSATFSRSSFPVQLTASAQTVSAKKYPSAWEWGIHNPGTRWLEEVVDDRTEPWHRKKMPLFRTLATHTARESIYPSMTHFPASIEVPLFQLVVKRETQTMVT